MIATWRWAILESSLSTRARIVALTLSVRMNKDGTIPARFAPGIRLIAKDTGYSKLDTVIQALTELREAGFIEVHESAGNPDRPGARPNNYRAVLPEDSLRTRGSTDHLGSTLIDNPRSTVIDHPTAPTDHRRSPIDHPRSAQPAQPAQPAQETSTDASTSAADPFGSSADPLGIPTDEDLELRKREAVAALHELEERWSMEGST